MLPQKLTPKLLSAGSALIFVAAACYSFCAIFYYYETTAAARTKSAKGTAPRPPPRVEERRLTVEPMSEEDPELDWKNLGSYARPEVISDVLQAIRHPANASIKRVIVFARYRAVATTSTDDSVEDTTKAETTPGDYEMVSAASPGWMDAKKTPLSFAALLAMRPAMEWTQVCCF